MVKKLNAIAYLAVSEQSTIILWQTGGQTDGHKCHNIGLQSFVVECMFINYILSSVIIVGHFGIFCWEIAISQHDIV